MWNFCLFMCMVVTYVCVCVCLRARMYVCVSVYSRVGVSACLNVHNITFAYLATPSKNIKALKILFLVHAQIFYMDLAVIWCNKSFRVFLSLNTYYHWPVLSKDWFRNRSPVSHERIECSRKKRLLTWIETTSTMSVVFYRSHHSDYWPFIHSGPELNRIWQDAKS